jgi:hypothetical protein
MEKIVQYLVDDCGYHKELAREGVEKALRDLKRKVNNGELVDGTHFMRKHFGIKPSKARKLFPEFMNPTPIKTGYYVGSKFKTDNRTFILISLGGRGIALIHLETGYIRNSINTKEVVPSSVELSKDDLKDKKLSMNLEDFKRLTGPLYNDLKFVGQEEAI